MSLLPPEASFEELVQDCFLAYRGSGLALSALDAELLRSWAGLGIPFEVVALGIRHKAERALWDAKPQEPLLQSLKACRRQVEREFRKHLSRIAGRAVPSTAGGSSKDDEKNSRRRLRAVLRKIKTARPELEPALSKLYPIVQSPDGLVIGVIRALPFLDRICLLREARQALSLGAVASARARRLARRSARAAMLRKRLSLPNFW